MKGAFVLGNSPNLYAAMEEALIADGGRSAAGQTAQVEDRSGVLFTVFGDVGHMGESESRAAPAAVCGDVRDLRQDAATACWVECRSEDVFVRWIREIAAGLADPIWVLDGDGVLWAVESLDPSELVL